MKFYERMLKKRQILQNATMEEKQNFISIFKHTHMAIFLTEIIMRPHTGIIIGLVEIVVLALSLFMRNTLVLCIWTPIVIIYDVIFLYMNHKVKHEEYDWNDMNVWLMSKIQNICLLNGQVISHKDWKKIKKFDKEKFKYFRSEECDHKCYQTTYLLARMVHNPEIKIIWMTIKDYVNGSRYGHAVITKGGYIYDSNRRRTYKVEEYLELAQAEIYREFSIEEYSQDKYVFLKEYLDEFEQWCNTRNVVCFDN